MKTGKDKNSKDVGVQTELESVNYVPPRILSGMQLSVTAYPKFFTEPHMALLLSGICLGLAYFGFMWTEEDGDKTFVQNSKL